MARNPGDAKHKNPSSLDDEVHACDPERWLDRYGDGLYRQAIFRTGNTAVAEDLVQETLLAAWRGHAKFSGAAQERTWLYGILEHKIQDHYRQNAHAPVLQDVDMDDLDPDIEDAVFQANGSWASRPGAWGHDPQEAIERKDFLRIFRDCLKEIPEQQRTAFMLREWYGEEIAVCAMALAVTVNHLSVLLHRARLQISRCLGMRFAEGDNR